jgi:hypothetical protein
MSGRKQQLDEIQNLSSFNTHTQGELCFYHDKYENKSQKWRSPCSFPGNRMSGRRNRMLYLLGTLFTFKMIYPSDSSW